jgi:ribosome-associated heat shock protein Hsp15
MRVDKFVWCVRLAKTRSEANKMCEKGMVKLNGDITKSSKLVTNNAIIAIKHNPIWKVYRVIEIPKSRIGAKLLTLHLHNITPPEDLETLKNIEAENRKNYLQGLKGRPTKKDRRDIDEFRD